MFAADAQHTLSRLQHWETRLASELEILRHDIESSEMMHQKCTVPQATTPVCACESRPPLTRL